MLPMGHRRVVPAEDVVPRSAPSGRSLRPQVVRTITYAVARLTGATFFIIQTHDAQKSGRYNSRPLMSRPRLRPRPKSP